MRCCSWKLHTSFFSVDVCVIFRSKYVARKVNLKRDTITFHATQHRKQMNSAG